MSNDEFVSLMLVAGIVIFLVAHVVSEISTWRMK